MNAASKPDFTGPMLPPAVIVDIEKGRRAANIAMPAVGAALDENTEA
jgi:hypothetical protein